MSKLIDIAIKERMKQLRRQETAATNEFIKDIIRKEIEELTQQWLDIGNTIKQIPPSSPKK